MTGSSDAEYRLRVALGFVEMLALSTRTVLDKLRVLQFEMA